MCLFVVVVVVFEGEEGMICDSVFWCGAFCCCGVVVVGMEAGVRFLLVHLSTHLLSFSVSLSCIFIFILT